MTNPHSDLPDTFDPLDVPRRRMGWYLDVRFQLAPTRAVYLGHRAW